MPSVSFGLPYNELGLARQLTAVLGLAGRLSCLTDRALLSSNVAAQPDPAQQLYGNPKLTDGTLQTLLSSRARSAEEGLKGGMVPSVSFGLPYNCCAGSGWACLQNKESNVPHLRWSQAPPCLVSQGHIFQVDNTSPRTSSQAARALPRRLFGASLLAAPEPAEVSERILRQRGIVKEIPLQRDGGIEMGFFFGI